ncbi:MAG: glycosyltransferase, partial [Phycisphaerae bacterium]
PYVACYLDPVTSTMAQVGWADHWQLLESNTWIKWIPEITHSEELARLGVPNIVTMPMAAANDDFDTSPLPDPDPGPAVAFMGHPASSWFQSQQPVRPGQLFAGLTAAAVRADMPDLPFHKIYYDLYQFADRPKSTDDLLTRAKKSGEFYAQKFTYNAYLAIKQRDRFARFLKIKLGDTFELIGDHWDTHYGLKHTPRIWDLKVLHDRMRRVPICLNFIKGNWETGLIIRHFEVPAYGGFQLAYHTAELPACFEIGKECDVFHDEAELLEKIHYYLDRPDERREIAAAGQRRTLSEHLYSHRITKLVDLLHQAGVLPRQGVAGASSTPTPKIHVEGVTDEPVPTTSRGL